MRKSFIIALGIFLALTALALADVKVANIVRPDVPDFVGYVPNEFVVQFKADLGKITQARTALGLVAIGNAALDELGRKYEVAELRTQFPGAQPTMVKGQVLDLSRYFVVKFESGHDLEQVMAEYRANPYVESVEPIGIHALYATPNDGFYASDQWHLNQASDKDVDAPEAWDIETGDPSIIVAVMDSGVRYYHKDLGGSNASSTNPGGTDGNIWINLAEKNGTAGVDDDGNGYVDDWVGYDFVTGLTGCWSGEDCSTADNDPRDFNGHGTHCAGNVGAINNNGYASCSVAGGWGNGALQPTGNGVKVMPLRIGWSQSYLGQEAGYVRMDFAASALYYAANKGAKIASCSWGASNSGGIDAAITYFLNAGGMIFKAAGNANNQTSDYMTARTDIIAVAATDQNDCRASFSSYGTWVEISAPGVAILSSYHDHTDAANDYVATMDGTSMATPIAASVAALIWSANPTWTAAQVRDRLYATADNIYGLSCNSAYAGKLGAGRVNAYNAVFSGGCTAPTAQFSGTPLSGSAPLAVTFTNSSSGTAPLSYSWAFGDGGTSTATSPVYTYTTPGTYTVTLTATNSCGSDQEVKTGYVTVTAPPAQQCDDFNDNNISNWVNSTGTWSVSGGIVTGNSNTQNSKRTSPFGAWTNPTVTCQVRMNSGRTQRNARIIFNYVDANNYRFIEGDDVNNYWRIYSRVSGTNTVRATFSATISTATWYNVEVNVTSTGNTTLKVNGATLGSYNFGSAPSGLVGIGYSRANSNFDNFCVGASSSLEGPVDQSVVEIGEPITKTDPLPHSFELSQNYPNPFNPTTTIKYFLPEVANVELVIVNVMGQTVRTLVNAMQAPGEHSVMWDGRDQSGVAVASGIYLYKMRAGDFTETRKMVLMK
ncbi:MAG: S8 family serine peptidase [candidate division Zixibacteria bacterium]|nr:S8 family serine peptidase [candidate division Zixibacteria bacterium]